MGLKSKYEDSKEEGVDESITEYLHLSDLKDIISERALYHTLGYETRGRFEEDFGALVDFRHSVAHPVRSLKGTDGSPESMWENVETCECALFHLHNQSSREVNQRGK